MIQAGVYIKSGVNGYGTEKIVQILASRKDVAQLVANLVGIVMNQMNKRESNLHYPNEDSDTLI